MVVFASHCLFVLLDLLPRFLSLQKVLDGELILLGQGSDEFHDLAVADEQLKQQLEQELQFIEVAVLNQSKKSLLSGTGRGEIERLVRLGHHFHHCTEIVHPQLEIAMGGRVPFLHHRRQTQRLRIGSQLWHVCNAWFLQEYVARRQA